MKIIKNKKGEFRNIIFFVLIVLVIIAVGIALAFGSAILRWTADEVVPEIRDLGVVGGANLTEIADYTVTPINNIIQSMGWMAGILYVIMILGTFFLAFIYRSSGNRWFISIYLLLVLIIIICSIFFSNAYEDFYNDAGEVGDQLRDMKILSYLILYSPMIFTVIAFIAGIIMFIPREEDYV